MRVEGWGAKPIKTFLLVEIVQPFECSSLSPMGHRHFHPFSTVCADSLR
jgi:hypothetical protein